MIDSYTLNWAENKLIVTFQDGTIKEYTQNNSAEYAADYPDRVTDIMAMGWKF